MEILKKLIELIPFLEPYPAWVKGLIAVWAFMSVGVALALTLAPRQPSTNPTQISGLVKNPEGGPVPAARVIAIAGEFRYVDTADSEGRFHIDLPSGFTQRSARLTISAPGYSEYERIVGLISKETETGVMTLQHVGTRAPSAAPDLVSELKRRQADLVAIPTMLGDRYASAIAQGKVGGLFKLLSSNAVDANRAIINTPGDFRYYSMFRRTHEYGFGNEIALERGNVKTGFAGLDYGFFLALGEVDIDRFVDLSTATPTWLDNKLTPAWKFFVDHTPPSITAEVRAQQRKSRRMLIENVAFGDAAAVIDGNVLLLRSVQYNDSDTLSALRIERSVEDGSVILAWKLLKKYPVPLAAGPEPSEP